MKRHNFILSPRNLLFSFISLFFLLISCEPEKVSSPADDLFQADLKVKTEKFNDFYGPSKHMGNGVVRSVVSITHNGIPEAVGIVISEKALQNLPMEEQNLHLKLSNKAEGLGLMVDHIDIGWNPQGHDPVEVYTFPHFDVHFYWISVEQVDAIPFAIGNSDLPPMEYRPADYTSDMVTVPQMGRHWLYDLAPENQGGTFGQTFIYGSWDSSFTFYEPMITKGFLEEKDFEDSYDIVELGGFDREGYYANSYKISYDPVKKEYRVMLTNLHWEEVTENL